MPCMGKTFNCHIRNSYIGVGNPHYHGELCMGCMFWQDSPEDLAFKVKVGIIEKEKETPEWF